MKIMKGILVFEIVFLMWGIFALLIANYIIRKEELKKNLEWQNGLKVHTVYKNCLCDDESNTRREFEK